MLLPRLFPRHYLDFSRWFHLGSPVHLEKMPNLLKQEELVNNLSIEYFLLQQIELDNFYIILILNVDRQQHKIEF